MSRNSDRFEQSVAAVPWAFIDDLGTARDLTSTLEVMVTWVPKFVEADRVSISLINSDGDLDLLAVNGLKISPVGTTFQVEGSLVGKAFTEQNLINVTEVTDDTPDGMVLTSVGMKSGLVAPLLSLGRCFGTFNVAHPELAYYSEADERIVGALASLVASFVRVHFEMEEEQKRARVDSLTGVLNRSGLMSELDKKFGRKSSPVTVLFLDLDGFKAINDAYGHAAGDKVLVDLADRFQSSLRPEDLLGRIGGDEFVVACGVDTDRAAGMEIAERLIHEGQRPLDVGPTVLTPRLSVGVAVADSEKDTAERVLAEADQAMYEAKKNKKLIVVADEDLRTRADLVAAVDRDLGQALETNEITFFLQPVWAIASGRLAGAEALVRWNHPTHGAIPPPLLVARIEATGRIEHFTEWSLDAVAATLAEMRSELPGLASLPVSINLTPQQLSWSEYLQVHLQTLANHNLEPADLAVELVESGTVEVGMSAEDTLRSLAEAGVSIALDDFGTGSNALGYFTRFDIDAIKIDKTLIYSMATSAPTRTIVAALVSMAKRLNVKVLGEGIETQEEMDLCYQHGIEFGQGYHLGRPMPVEAFKDLARSSVSSSTL